MPVLGTANISKLADALRETANQSELTTQQVLVQSANHILAEMEARVPVRSGNLRQSLGVQVHSDKVIIGPNEKQAPYAGYVEFGTRPHEIRPRKQGGVLVFNIGGRKVFTRKVSHPGTKPQPYVAPAFKAWVDSLGTMAAEANVKVIKNNAA
jgi:HK97 gp10 family phage protein